MPNRFEQFAQPQPSANRFSQFAAAPLRDRIFDNPEDEALYKEKLAEIQRERSRPQVPFYTRGEGGEEININEIPAEELAIELTQKQRGKEAEEKSFKESRTPLARVADTAAFVPSSFVRAATQGKYGLGDVVGAVAPEAGEAIAESEAGFARANRPGLELLGAAGEVSLGIPFLSTMGAPARGVSATAKTLAAKPSARQLARAGVRHERLADIEAFERSGVQPFGPALTETGSAAAVKQLSEVPVVGQPIRNALRTAVEQTQDAGENVAAQYGTARSFRDAGLAAERGLERFKDARPGDVVEDAITAMPDEQLRSIIAKPARETSAKTRLAALYERAWRGVPEHMRLGRTEKERARFGGQMTETRAVLQDITARNTRMLNTAKQVTKDDKIAYPIRGGLAGQIVEDILAASKDNKPPTYMLQDMRNVRSTFRRLASGVSDTEKNTLTRADLDRVQSAMTKDLVRTLQRNQSAYAAEPGKLFTVRAATNGQPAVQMKGAQIAKQIERSIIDFRRADTATRRNAELLETLNKLYKTDNPEAIARSVFNDAQGGTKGNYNRLFALKRALKPDEWNEMVSGLIRELGTPVRSARGVSQETGFSVNTFLTNWRGLDSKAKNILFGTGENVGRVKALNDFARVADKLANFEALVNSSRTATNLINFAALAGGGGLVAAGQIPALILGGLSTYGVSSFLSSQAYVRWLTRVIDVQSNPNKLVNPNAYIKQLARIAANDPGSEAKFAAELFLQQIDQAVNQSIRSQTSPAR